MISYPTPTTTRRHEVALVSIQGLLSIVAGLGITNTLRELFVVQSTTHMYQITALLCGHPSCAQRDLGLELWVVPVVVALLEIIIAFRFYQSSSIQIEDSYPSLPCPHLHHYLPALPHAPSPEDIQSLETQRQELRHQLQRRQTQFMWHTIGFVTEGIIVAAASFYVRYPADFVLLLISLFLVDSVMNFFQRGTSPEANRFLGANCLLSLVLLCYRSLCSAWSSQRCKALKHHYK